MTFRIVIALLATLGAATAQATEIYKWTDENGQVHFGEEVPDRYQKSAVKKDPGPLNTMQAPPSIPPAPAASQPPAPATPPPPPAVTNLSQEQLCRLQIQRYQESLACFAPYVNANGSVQPEAFQRCEQIPQPSCAGQLNNALP